MLIPYTKSKGHWPEIERIYLESFPAEERRPADDLRHRAESPAEPLKVFVVFNGNDMAGFISYWEFSDFVYVEHFAVDSGVRGSGIGSRALNEFVNNFNKPVVLEVEPPEANDMAMRRIKFYTRTGFRIVEDFDYVQPPYGPGLPSVPLLLMTTDRHAIRASSVAEVLHREVYGVCSMD